MNVSIKGDIKRNPVEETLISFFPEEKFVFLSEEIIDGVNIVSSMAGDILDLDVIVNISGKKVERRGGHRLSGDIKDSADKAARVELFKALCDATDIRPRWGIHAGVRPAKHARMLKEQLGSYEKAKRHLADEFLLDEKKAGIAVLVAQKEDKIIKDNDGRVCLYIAIPFCPARCAYCSFVSQSVGSAINLIEPYIENLKKEIETIARGLRKKEIKLGAIYIGGGTPGILPTDALAGLLSCVNENFDLSFLYEYTFEYGRCDLVTKEKLEILKGHGVSRIAINPQSMDEDVLKWAKRPYKLSEFIGAYFLAKETGFDAVNMDLILGLKGESGRGFLSGLERVIELKPQNITVHALTKKRASTSSIEKEDMGLFSRFNEMNAAMDDAYALLQGGGYGPYYMYRQKRSVASLENVGFEKGGTFCAYNVLMTDECADIYSVGAGAVSKVDGERIYNVKYPHEYNERIRSILEQKEKIFL